MKFKLKHRKFDILETVKSVNFSIVSPMKNININKINNVNKISKDNFFIFINNDNNCNGSIDKNSILNEKLSNFTNLETIIRSESTKKESSHQTYNNNYNRNNSNLRGNDKHLTINSFTANNLNLLETKIEGIKTLNTLNSKKPDSEYKSTLSNNKRSQTNLNSNININSVSKTRGKVNKIGNLSHNLSYSNKKQSNNVNPLLKMNSNSNNFKILNKKEKPINLKKIRYDYNSKSKSPLRIDPFKISSNDKQDDYFKVSKDKFKNENNIYSNEKLKELKDNPKDKDKTKDKDNKRIKSYNIIENSAKKIKESFGKNEIKKNKISSNIGELNDGINNIKNLKYKMNSNHNNIVNIGNITNSHNFTGTIKKKNNFSCNLNLIRQKDSNDIIEAKNEGNSPNSNAIMNSNSNFKKIISNVSSNDSPIKTQNLKISKIKKSYD